MEQHLWRAVNPGGTLYNPISIAMAISILSDGEKNIDKFEESLFKYNGIWNSSLFDSSFSSLHKENCVEEFINRSRLFSKSLKEGKTLIVTFGTSICYQDVRNNLVVGNCHKLPSGMFTTRRMTQKEISDIWKVTLSDLKARVPELKTIFTVSPVRHLKNGFTGNSLSKAVLQLGVEDICKTNPDTWYFPAYEILIDDLRDYRFYASDLIHPSEEGIEYIWQKFVETFIDEEGKKILEEGCRQVKASFHRPKLGALGLPLS